MKSSHHRCRMCLINIKLKNLQYCSYDCMLFFYKKPMIRNICSNMRKYTYCKNVRKLHGLKRITKTPKLERV